MRWNVGRGHSQCGLHINRGDGRACRACAAANASNALVLEGVSPERDGRRKGGKSRTTDAQVSRVRQLHAEGQPITQIARDVELSNRSVSDIIHGMSHNPRTKTQYAVIGTHRKGENAARRQHYAETSPLVSHRTGLT